MSISAFFNAASISTHILTKRMTYSPPVPMITSLYFNSHPHEEDDNSLISFGIVSDISTHILTKRMTSENSKYLKYLDISTHILTKRMTICLLGYSVSRVISTHILTKRMTTSLRFTVSPTLFQLTSSRRG